jgi:hypothetical protein
MRLGGCQRDATTGAGTADGRTPSFSAATESDLNLLRALDALLAEGSVLGAARRVGVSPPPR